MLARDSAGRSVSLLNIHDININDDISPLSSPTTVAAASPSLAANEANTKSVTLPSFSSLYGDNTRFSRLSSNSYSAASTTRKSSSYYATSPRCSTDSRPSPTLSSCSTQFNTETPSSQSGLSLRKLADSAEYHSSIRPGPTPLFKRFDSTSTNNSNTDSVFSAYSGKTSSSTTTSSSTPASSYYSRQNSGAGGATAAVTESKNINKTLPQLPATPTSPAAHHILDQRPMDQHFSAATATATIPPSSFKNNQPHLINTISHNTAAYPTSLSSTTLPSKMLLTQIPMGGVSPIDQRQHNLLYQQQLPGTSMTASNMPTLPLNPQYFSVPQQPLPAVTASSPTMYSTIDSPTSLTMMDPYQPLQQPQLSTMGFPSYPSELMPGSMTQSNQSVTATSPSDTSNNSAPKTTKKKYPCPHAAKYNCSDLFTTSGHAARHGKKHTGEKNIHCPVCNKAFTRKDNMKQHERTHRNKGEASKVAEAVETSKRAHALSLSKSSTNSSLSKSSTNSSTEIEMEDTPSVQSSPQATIQKYQRQRPAPTAVQKAPSSLMPSAADIPMPVTLDSGETLQPVAPSLEVESMRSSHNIFDNSFITRSQDNIFGRPALFERTTSNGSGFSADGEGESPGLDALAMAAAELS